MATRARGRVVAAVLGGLVLAATLAGCGGEPAAPPPAPPPPARSSVPAPPVGDPGPVAATSPDGRGAVRPMATPTGCTATVTDPGALKPTLAGAGPGAKICVLGDLSGARLVVRRSGTAQAPIIVVGDGRTLVKGITVEGNFVAVDGVNAMSPRAPGIELKGNTLLVQNSTVISPHDEDGDGIRFWGNDIVIRHNTIRHTRNVDAHADCMQTFATDEDSPASNHVTIDSNRCEDIANTCLIMEGPNSLAGDGSGVGASADVVFTNNFCDNRASEALQIDDVQRLTVTGNQIAGPVNHAFALQNRSTGARISGNQLNPAVRYEVGADASCVPGYLGPLSGGVP